MNPTPHPLRRTKHSKMTASYARIDWDQAKATHILTVAGLNTGNTHHEIEIAVSNQMCGLIEYYLLTRPARPWGITWRTRLACWLINSAKGAK